jgi:diguanylate cyclase (GGDEF)-like protein/PAS domain S-box-containing protein
MNKRHLFYSLPMILLLTVAIAGWFTTDYLSKNVQQEIVGENRASTLTLSTHVSSTFIHIEGAVKSLAGSPWIAPALMSKRDQDIEHANSALDRYNSAMDASVSYLMDADGMTVASSNRNDPDSFVGKFYRFRPYFQEAARGQPGRYFALGITSGKRGFYASYPVKNRLGKVLGVVTMKKDLDEMETFFSRYPLCFLVNPNGVIFLSSKPAMVLKNLWPTDIAAREQLIASQQFGNKLSETVLLKKEVADGTEITLEGNRYLVSRKVIDREGWSTVLLTPLYHVKIYKLIGILSTIFVCFLIMVFSGIIYITDRSKKAIWQSEESKRLLLHAAGEGIFGVDTAGRVTFINPAALRMLGFVEEEVLGQSAHALMHHSHEDGSNYPVEACPMYASYTIATESSAIEEVLWRKDGSKFSVVYSSMPIIRDGKAMGAVVTFRDITERKQADDVLKESEERQRLLFDNAISAIAIHDIVLDSTGKPVDYVFLSANRAFETHTGLHVAEILGRRVTEVLPGIENVPFIEIYGKVVLTGEPVSFQQYSEPLGRYYAINAYRLRAGRFATVFTDITERQKIEEALKESEARMRTITDSAQDAILMMDPEGRVSYWNPAAERILGYAGDEAIGKNLHQLIAPQRYHEAHRAAFDTFKKTGQGNAINSTLELEACHKNGHEISVELSLSSLRLKNGWHTVGIIRDVTERKQAEEKLKHLSIHDSLTGLHNRFLFEEELRRLGTGRFDPVGIVMCDLDGLKLVNDNLGHDVGNLQLVTTANLLKEHFRSSDIVARIGGDEFAVLLPSCSLETIKDICDRLKQAMLNRYIPDTKIPLMVSIGYAVRNTKGCPIEELLKEADVNMYKAKGENRQVFREHFYHIIPQPLVK